MLWDAKVCRVDDFESNFVRGPGHLAQSMRNLLELALRSVTKPLRSPKEMHAGVLWPTRR
jgi:hypothetical protein